MSLVAPPLDRLLLMAVVEKDRKLIVLERPPVIETAILVRLALPRDTDEEVHESLEEMKRLASTAGAMIACTFIQRRAEPCPATLIGAGKVEQVRAAALEHDANLVLFDSDLTPTQGAKLQKALDVKVLDRTQLILDIFAQRARTNEGKHQVELAQLQYTLPRLTGRGVEMARLGGGIGTRGPGEQKLEVDRRVIRKRIDRLRAELEEIRKHRRVQRKKRAEDSAGTVALVGYTNAGKSSLLNALTRANVFVEDKLFATLDPTSRRCSLPGKGSIILTDTVGFIRKLPHSLVAAFRATLEEVNEADLILLVADVSHGGVDDHIRAVLAVLDEIGALDKPIVTVYNKTDAADPHVVRMKIHSGEDCVAVSAKTGEGLDALLRRMDAHFASTRRRVTLRIPQREPRLIARIYEHGRVIHREYRDDSVILDAEVDASLGGAIAPYEWRPDQGDIPVDHDD